MSQKLPINNFNWIEDTFQFNEDFIKTIIKKVIQDIFLKLMFNILKNYMNFLIILTFLLERKNFENVEKLAANLHDKYEYVIHIINLKQALNHRLVLKKVHRVIKFNQNAWLKLYIDMNTDLRKKQKMTLRKTFSC